MNENENSKNKPKPYLDPNNAMRAKKVREALNQGKSAVDALAEEFLNEDETTPF